MYNYPYALPGYGLDETPPFQVRAACEALAEPSLEGANLLKAMLKALNVFYPMSSCFNVPSYFTIPSSTFDYQVHVTAHMQACCFLHVCNIGLKHFQLSFQCLD